MKHSNRKEIEESYKNQLDAARREKLREQPVMDAPTDIEEVPKKSAWRTFCCFLVMVILALSAILIYYIYLNVHEAIEKELQNAPAKIEDLKNKADATVKEGQELYQKAEDAKKKVDEIKGQVDSITNQVNSLSNSVR